MDYLWSAMGLKPRDPSKKTPAEMVDDLKRMARDLEGRIQAQDRAFHTERANAARYHKAGEKVSALQALSRSKATRKNIELMQTSASNCWSLAVHIDSLGLLKETFDVMQQSSAMIDGLLKTSKLDPEKVKALTERLQESTQTATEIQNTLSLPLDINAAAMGELDFDVLDAELDAIDLDDELAAATLPVTAVAAPEPPTPKQTVAAAKPATAKAVPKAVSKTAAARAASRNSVMPPIPLTPAERAAQTQLARFPVPPTTVPSVAAAAAATSSAETSTLSSSSSSSSSSTGRVTVMVAETTE
jgi:hypothetical protein